MGNLAMGMCKVPRAKLQIYIVRPMYLNMGYFDICVSRTDTPIYIVDPQLHTHCQDYSAVPATATTWIVWSWGLCNQPLGSSLE